MEVVVLGEPGALERPGLLDVDPLELPVGEPLYLWLGALSRRRDHGTAARARAVRGSRGRKAIGIERLVGGHLMTRRLYPRGHGGRPQDRSSSVLRVGCRLANAASADLQRRARWVSDRDAGRGAFLALLAYGLTSKGTDDRIDEALASGSAPRRALRSRSRCSSGARCRRASSASWAPRSRTSASPCRAARRARGPEPVGLLVHAVPGGGEARSRTAGARMGPKGVLFLGLDIQDLRDDGRDVHPRVRRHLSERARARAGGREQLWRDRHPGDVLHRRPGPRRRPRDRRR